jgi:anti-sigma regulatory factor (Ser/Thr protein kinase)
MQSESIIIHATQNDILLPTVHLREMLTVNQVSEEVIKSCESALNELLKNIVDHACEEKEHQLITVSIAYNNSGVYIETQDEGIPVNFAISKLISAKNLEPTLQTPETNHPPKNILDEIWYEIDMGKNIWQLVKYI